MPRRKPPRKLGLHRKKTSGIELRERRTRLVEYIKQVKTEKKPSPLKKKELKRLMKKLQEIDAIRNERRMN